MHDDGFYILMAGTLARTGHVVFNGWGAPMLGIQLLPAALLVRLFGFSFSLVRFTTVIVALLLTGLLQRTLVRCGLREWNASIATITVMTSPVVLPLVTSFATDIWSLFAIVVCLYCCLRALQAPTARGAAGWICGATLGNAVLGTTRQIAWLGLLVMVPCTVWLLRSRREVVRAGAVAWVVSVGFIFACVRWLAAQTYTLPEPFNFHGIRQVSTRLPSLLRPALEIPMLALPVLLMFLAKPNWSYKGRKVAIVGLAILCACGWHEHYVSALHDWFVPFILEHGSVFGPKGVYRDWPAWGNRPDAVPDWLRAVLSIATLTGLIAWLSQAVDEPKPGVPPRLPTAISRRELAFLTFPFAAAYAVFLAPRALRDLTIDRYVIPLFLIALVWMVLCYQDRVSPKLPRVSMAIALAIALYSTATLQDAFGMYRAVVRAGNELRAAGVPRTAYDGGWEYDGMTQVLAGGYVHQIGIRMPPGQVLRIGHRRFGSCEMLLEFWIPDWDPQYALAYTPDGCGGSTAFAPITYRRLLWPHEITLYVVKDGS